jgi:type I restriction enzyme, S subunit
VPTLVAVESLVIPPKCITKAFCEVVKSGQIKIMKNKAETQTLTAIRDALLPKLMSGEIDL